MFRTMRVLALAGLASAFAGAGAAAPKLNAVVTAAPPAAPKPDCASGRYTGDSHICTAGRHAASSHLSSSQARGRYTGDSAICTAARSAGSSKPASSQPGGDGDRRYTGDSAICTAARTPAH